MAMRTLFPYPCDNDFTSHIPFSLARYLSQTDLREELWVKRRGPRARAAFVKAALPGPMSSLIERMGGRLQPGSSWSQALMERRYIAALREGDVAHLYRGCSLRLIHSLREHGHLIFMERMNTMERTLQRIMDDAYARAGWPVVPDDPRILARDQEETEAADFVFSPSPAVTTSLREGGIPERKILTCSYGWDPERFHTTRRALPPVAGVTVLFVGRIGARKGAHLLLRAWSRAGVAGRLVLVGEVEPLIAAHCASLLARADVVHCEYDPDPEPFYRSADVFAFPTLEEGSPLVLYEAMGTGLPIVTSAMGAGDVARHGTEALIVEPHDEEQLIAALRLLAADPERRRAMGAAGRLRAAEYTWERVAQRRYTLIKNVLAAR
jgi:glycosyltransferase involved in cell wall biosynthesis